MTMIVSRITRRILLVTKSINHSVVLVGGVVATHAITLLGREVNEFGN